MLGIGLGLIVDALTEPKGHARRSGLTSAATEPKGAPPSGLTSAASDASRARRRLD